MNGGLSSQDHHPFDCELMETVSLKTTMSKCSPSQPPRLLPDRPFPPYAYVPGETPHPTRDPGGHSYGAEFRIPEPPDPEDWRACRDYLYGIDLFNHGFYWEAHEAWEGLWVACGRHGPTATYLQALISLAAAGLKARSGCARGMRANADKAVSLLESVASRAGSHRTRYMGLDVSALANFATAISKTPQTTGTPAGDENLPTFDLLLWPD
jgi:uncharacterized protein